MKIGIFGCTADPCTIGHYEIVKKVLADKLVDKVIIVPTVVDYHRNEKDSMFSLEERAAILQNWFSGLPNASVDLCEYNLPILKASSRRFIFTLEDIIAKYGNENEYFTILGEDSYRNLTTWYSWNSILKLSKLIVVDRNCQPDGRSRDYEETVPVSQWVRLDKKFDNISASKVRKELHDGMSGMSMGPSATYFGLYTEMIDEYLRKEKADELIAHTPIFDLMRGNEVQPGFRPVRIKSPDWVTIVVEKNGKYMREKQFRYGINVECEEFPCGMVEPGENIYNAAARELAEETGIVVNANDFIYIGSCSANPAFMTNRMHYFYINLDRFNYRHTECKLDEHEKIDAFWQDKAAAVKNTTGNGNVSVFMLACIGLLRDKKLL